MKKPLIKEGYIEIKNIKSRMNKEIISRFFLIKLALGVLLRASELKYGEARSTQRS